MRLLAAVTFLALFAGCLDPSASPAPAANPAPTSAPAPTYAFRAIVTEETADGAPLPGAEVVAYVLDPSGDALTGIAVPATTDATGVARFSFREPVRLALRATLPGWTQEGTTLAVAEQVIVGDGLVASDRDIFLPLFHASLRLSSGLLLSTQTAAPDDMGNLVHPFATADLVLPERAKAAYLARLAGADVRLAWSETATDHADLAAGLAWDGRLWVRGAPAGPSLLPTDRSVSYSDALPAEGRPADLAAATLQAAAVTETAVVGDVPLAVEVELRFAGQVPAGLPAPCHATMLCPLPLPPVAG